MKKTIKLTILILWMTLIFCFSNQNANESTKVSNGIIVSVAKVFVPKGLLKEKEEKILTDYTVIVRKTAHFGIYLVLGILVFSFLSEYKLKYLILYSILFCVLYSISDEVHQLFTYGRSGEIRDIIIDSFGSSIGILGYYYLKKCKICKIR